MYKRIDSLALTLDAERLSSTLFLPVDSTRAGNRRHTGKITTTNLSTAQKTALQTTAIGSNFFARHHLPRPLPMKEVQKEEDDDEDEE